MTKTWKKMQNLVPVIRYHVFWIKIGIMASNVIKALPTNQYMNLNVSFSNDKLSVQIDSKKIETNLYNP